jgi:hypothetical protein
MQLTTLKRGPYCYTLRKAAREYTLSTSTKGFAINWGASHGVQVQRKQTKQHQRKFPAFTFRSPNQTLCQLLVASHIN